MRRLIHALALLLSLTLLPAEPAWAAWSQGQKVASGSAAVVELSASESARLSAERTGENVALSYDIASGSPVAARGAAAAAGTRTATTAFGRSVQSLRDALSSGSGPWTQVSAHAERATAKAYRGGTSIEQIFVNRETGERLVRHTVVRGDELLHETFRPYSKFGID